MPSCRRAFRPASHPGLRITRIWGFTSLEERAAFRARPYAAGVWPPQGGPEQIIKATSTIALPESYSPLH